MSEVKCLYENCFRLGSEHCKKCENNRARNKVEDHFKQCMDNDISDLKMVDGAYDSKLFGPAEQGGIQCPACGHLHNVYTFKDGNCEMCGLPMRVCEVKTNESSITE